MEETAAQEGVRQLLLVVRRDDDDGAALRPDGLAGFVDEEFHAIQLLQQVVGELDVGLVDLVDQEHRALRCGEGFPQLAAADVVGDVMHALVAELRVAEPRHRVIFIEALLGFRRRLDVPLDDGGADGGCDLTRQHGLAGAGLALHEERAFEHDGGIDGRLEVIGCDVIGRSFKAHLCEVLPVPAPAAFVAFPGPSGKCHESVAESGA